MVSRGDQHQPCAIHPRAIRSQVRRSWFGSLLVVVVLSLFQYATAAAEDSVASLTDVKIASTVDGHLQLAKSFIPRHQSNKAIPLLVILHSWSADYTQPQFVEPCLAECDKRGWALIHPNFRGPNLRPEACGSRLAVQDVLDAVAWMQKTVNIDTSRIYLVGTSGGGHMSLLMAGQAPKVWAGVSAWVPISDVAAWHAERTVRGGDDDKYRKHMQTVCGGSPGSSKKADREYQSRSPLTYLAKAVDIPIDINTGIHDGHAGSVPISQSLNAFNLLAVASKNPELVIAQAQIDFMQSERKISPDIAHETVKEDGRIKSLLFRRKAGNARITIFDGGHESDMPTAVRWLAKQRKLKP